MNKSADITENTDTYGMRPKLLIIEPFYGGSHKKFINIICSKLPPLSYTLITMTPKKWHWRARTSALYISTQIPHDQNYKTLLCTSVLPLAELVGLRPDLAKLTKVVYFHENQLNYPVRVTKERDFQYGFNEILSCLAADTVLFNSCYNRDSFLDNINNHICLQPDYKVKNIHKSIISKCQVVYYPLNLREIDKHISSYKKKVCKELHIVWPHRWEFDKNPKSLYSILCRLDANGFEFKLSILGECFSEKPAVFHDIESRFSSRLLHCGYVENETQYYHILQDADVVLSTAIHEFFGVSMLEAVYCECVPVVPNCLSYVEFYQQKIDYMFNNEDELYKILSSLCIEKLEGKTFKQYKHLALPFEANEWYASFSKIID